MKWFLFYLALIFIDKKILLKLKWYQRYIAFMGGLGTKAARGLISLFCRHEWAYYFKNLESKKPIECFKCGKRRGL